MRVFTKELRARNMLVMRVKAKQPDGREYFECLSGFQGRAAER